MMIHNAINHCIKPQDIGIPSRNANIALLSDKAVAQDLSSAVPLQTCSKAIFLLSHLTMQHCSLHSPTHAYGWQAEEAAGELRKYLANITCGHSREVILTAGAMESMNMIVKGVA